MTSHVLPIHMAVMNGLTIEGFDAHGPLGLLWYSGTHKRWFAVKPGRTDPAARIEPTHWIPPHYVCSDAARLLDFIRGHRRGTA